MRGAGQTETVDAGLVADGVGVQTAADKLDTRRRAVDNGDAVPLGAELLRHGVADLAGADDDDFHNGLPRILNKIISQWHAA